MARAMTGLIKPSAMAVDLENSSLSANGHGWHARTQLTLIWAQYAKELACASHHA